MNNIPTLRFPKFSDEWIVQKLGAISIINPRSETLPESFIYIDLESVVDGELLKEQRINFEEAPSRAQRFLWKNDILFQMVRPYQMNNLYFDKDGQYVASTGYAQIRTDKNPRFLFQYLHFQKFVDKVIESCTGTSYPAINSTDLANISVSLPTLPEQTKIATFLTAIDDRLNQLKKKKTLLEQYKQGVMQKIFSREIRFKDEEGREFPKWEEKTLGELLDYEQPTKYLVESTEYQDNYPIPVLTAGKTFILGYTNETYGVYNSNLPVIIFDDFTTAIQYVDFPFKAKSSAMKILLPLDGVNIKFAYEAMSMLNYTVGGHERHWISKYSLLDISLPCLAEQTKIANFLSALDEKISLCDSQIAKTEQYKKGLLQQMFI